MTAASASRLSCRPAFFISTCRSTGCGRPDVPFGGLGFASGAVVISTCGTAAPVDADARMGAAAGVGDGTAAEADDLSATEPGAGSGSSGGGGGGGSECTSGSSGDGESGWWPWSLLGDKADGTGDPDGNDGSAKRGGVAGLRSVS